MSNFFPPPRRCGRLRDREELHSCKHHRKSSTMAFLALKLLHKLKDKKKKRTKNQNTAPLSKTQGSKTAWELQPLLLKRGMPTVTPPGFRKHSPKSKFPGQNISSQLKKKIWVHQYLWIETSLKWHTGCFAYFQIFIFSTEDMDSHMCYNKLVKYNKALQSVESLRIVYCEVKCSISSALGVLSLKWQ